MPVRVPTLRVYANPWVYLDEHGRPMGVVMVDVNNHVPDPGRFVGTRRAGELLEKERVEVVKGREHVTKGARHKLHLEVATEPEEVPNTPYYRERIKAGELFSADAQTASVAGLKEFLPVEIAEARAREEAIAKFDADNGAGACAALNGGDLPGQFFKASTALAAKKAAPPQPSEKAST